MLHMFPSRRFRYKSLVLVILAASLAATHLAGQWVKYPTAGVPRKADGKVDMLAPSPRMADGKPDFSGVWMTGEPNRPPPGGLSSPKEAASPRQPPSDSPGDQSNIRGSRQMANIGVDLPGGLPYQPWLVPIVKQRTDTWRKTTHTSGACRITFFALTVCRIC